MLIPSSMRSRFRRLLLPIANGLVAARVSPNAITVIGLLPAVGAGLAFAHQRIRLGGLLVGLSGLCDLLDGLVAKTANRGTKLGALLDSTVDRYAEIAIFMGLVALFREGNTLYGVLLAMAGSLMVSYLKARSEGLGLSCDVGTLQRPERLVILMLGALIGGRVLRWAIWVIAVFANFTAVERLLRMRGTITSPENTKNGG